MREECRGEKDKSMIGFQKGKGVEGETEITVV